jgi:hypothetical protein
MGVWRTVRPRPAPLGRKLNPQAVYGLHTIDQDAMGDRDA